MKMNAQQFIDHVNDEQVVFQTAGSSLADLTKDPAKLIQPMLSFVAEQINTGHLAQAKLVVEKTDIEFKIETSIINLPIRYVNTVSKIVNEGDDYPLNVYMIIESPDVNRSSLRIDEVASADEFAVNSDNYLKETSDWLTKYLQQIKDNQIAAKEAEKAAAKESKKKTTKKTTTKKTAKKKKATKKRTTKKSAKK